MQEDLEKIAYRKSIEQKWKKIQAEQRKERKAEKDRLKELEKRKSDVRLVCLFCNV